MKGLGALRCMEEAIMDKKKRLLTHLHYHEPCAAYSGGMRAIPNTIMDVEEDVIKEWHRGLVRARHLRQPGWRRAGVTGELGRDLWPRISPEDGDGCVAKGREERLCVFMCVCVSVCACVYVRLCVRVFMCLVLCV